MAEDVIQRAMSLLRPEVRRRLLGDFAAQVAYENPVRRLEPSAALAYKEVANLEDDELVLAIAAAITTALKLDESAAISFNQIKEIADKYEQLFIEVEEQFTGGEQAEIFCRSNTKRPVAQGLLRDQYECSAEAYVDDCERLWKSRGEDILKRVEQDYVNRFNAERFGQGPSRDEQAERLATIFRFMVASGAVYKMPDYWILIWGEHHVEQIADTDYEEFLC